MVGSDYNLKVGGNYVSRSRSNTLETIEGTKTSNTTGVRDTIRGKTTIGLYRRVYRDFHI